MKTRLAVRPLAPDDFARWLHLRACLWPDLRENPNSEAEARGWLAREDAAVFVLESEANLDGFVEVGERAYADGCDTSPVAFLEGWYVEASLRRKGCGAALVHAAESWARARGLTEFASDALLDEFISQQAHRALGFEEVERAVRYRKSLLTQAEAHLA